jgi:hypothetical protein
MAPRAGSVVKHLQLPRRKNGISIASPSCGVLPPAKVLYISHSPPVRVVVAATTFDCPHMSRQSQWEPPTVVWVGGKSGEGTTRAREALQRPLSLYDRRTVMRASPRTNSAESSAASIMVLATVR